MASATAPEYKAVTFYALLQCQRRNPRVLVAEYENEKRMCVIFFCAVIFSLFHLLHHKALKSSPHLSSTGAHGQNFD